MFFRVLKTALGRRYCYNTPPASKVNLMAKTTFFRYNASTMDNNEQQEETVLTKEEFNNIVATRVDTIADEFTRGFEFLQGLERTVTFFGSARLKEDSPYYQTAREIGRRISEYGIGVITGGGGGIMEAANRGAFEAKGYSLGLNIRLPAEQMENPYLNESTTFKYFFVRKVFLSYAAEAYIYFPGGFGTLDEFFEIMTLVQTHKMDSVPIILVGKDYWEKLDSFIREEVYTKREMIEEKDMNLYTITDDVEEVVNIVRHARIRAQH